MIEYGLLYNHSMPIEAVFNVKVWKWNNFSNMQKSLKFVKFLSRETAKRMIIAGKKKEMNKSLQNTLSKQ